nr:MAG TPA: hypothetical protein [Caudoviricetes sp.]
MEKRSKTKRTCIKKVGRLLRRYCRGAHRRKRAKRKAHSQ